MLIKLGVLTVGLVFSCALRSTSTTKRVGMGPSARLASGCWPNCPVSRVSGRRGRFLHPNHAIESISPSVMIPDHRLALLLDRVKQDQINNCLYHNTASPPSLYSDHMCDRADFPLRTALELSQHSDEVWYCQFSHDGTKLVTAGRDHSVIIYDATTFAVLHKLVEHEAGVAHASWSPDDTKLITCSQDKKARVWNVEVCPICGPILPGGSC